MSVIVYDGHMLAADMRATSSIGTIVKESKITKLTVDEKDYFVATTGSTRFTGVVMQWLKDNLGLDPHLRAEYPIGINEISQGYDMTAVVMFADERGMHHMHCYESSKFPDIYQLDQQNKHAFGSGAAYALGAMAMKANAVTAVKVASMLNAKCGDGYEAYVIGTGQYFRHDFLMDWNSDVPKEEPAPGPEVGA
ncbi:peptidase HslV family [Stenotrophomonas phage Siara]|uniref:Ntn hydrolase domain protein n=1 Tax=Stenotrophomonas phage Siara TaxID=2859658 RepID=A0AAE7WM59_9CAUD|nr:peptidase HslV family [Stenotrophomonas phage Siara]QYW02026.1 NTN hydrolase domain protein [Stenotrophomonas phage Siara]